VHVVVDVERGQHEDPRGRVEAAPGDLLGGLEPVEVRHPHVHEDDVRPQPDHLVHRGPPVGGFPHHDDVLLGVEQGAEPLAHHRLVVGDHDVHHGTHPAIRAGSSATTLQPPSSVGPAVRVPPTEAARSRMPGRPCPAWSPVATGPVPGPLATSSRTVSPYSRSTTTRLPWACREALASDSCRIRYRTIAGVVPTTSASPVTVQVMSSPAPSASRSSRSTSAVPGCGTCSACWPSLRSTPSIVRTS